MQSTFSNGKPCPAGHTGLRYTGNRGCVECHRVLTRGPRVSAARKAAYRANPEPARKRALRRYEEKRDTILSGLRSRTGSERLGSRINARRQKMKRINRAVAWADNGRIAAVYGRAQTLAELTGVAYHVDHILPLQGRKISGLHVHENLQVLPGVENMRKNNRYEVA